jgi:hypothetical protein
MLAAGMLFLHALSFSKLAVAVAWLCRQHHNRACGGGSQATRELVYTTFNQSCSLQCGDRAVYAHALRELTLTDNVVKGYCQLAVAA